nr:glycosyltransferase family 4 protein [uncultured Devosia sp.]
MASVAIIGNQGFSLLNFRGPLIEDLVARGHKVYALAPQIDDDIAEALRTLGAEPVPIVLARTGTNPLADLASVWHLRKVLGRIGPDICLGYAAKPAIYGTLAAWLAGVPSRFAMIEGLGYVFMPRSGEGLAKRILRQTVIGLFRVALARADRVFFLNPDDIADFSALGLVQPFQPVNIGGIGVDLDYWQPAPPVLDPVTFLFVGRLLKDKGVLDFIAAARQIKASYPGARFLLVGGIDENPESIAQSDVDIWVAEGLVEWAGHVPVRPWLRQASVFVLPSYYREGVPRSTQEAMAMARPIITTDSVGCRETVEDGRNGHLVPVRDPDALARAMLAFIEVPDCIVTMGANSRAMAEARFDVRKVNATIIDTMGL